MTLQDFFIYIGQHPTHVLAYFLSVPAIALLMGWIAYREGHVVPWSYVYSILIYLACIPGIFAVALNIYLFLFERRSIMNTNIFTQILPIISMLSTITFTKNNVNLDDVPGFHRISGLMWSIAAIIVFMWILDRTRIYSFTYLPFSQVIVIFIILLIMMRWGWSQFTRRKIS